VLSIVFLDIIKCTITFLKKVLIYLCNVLINVYISRVVDIIIYKNNLEKMKKVLLSVALVVAISVTSSVMAQDIKKDATPQKTECTKDGSKKCCKAGEKKCCKSGDKKCCNSGDKKNTKDTTGKKCCKKEVSQ